jgi:hypothetical protein
LILSFFSAKMNLPITENELKLIIEMLKGKHPQIYNKLWSYQFNKNKDKNAE